jgi:predicted TIM-barrel fold metal-dependent hydrolase
MIIDSHVHAGQAADLRESWNTFNDIEVSLRRMDQVGIDKAVVLPIGHGDFRRANRRTAEIVARHPDRLVGYAKVSQAEDAGRIDEMLDEAFGPLGLVGLKLHGHPNREVMDAAKRHGVPVLVDPKHEPAPLRYAAEEYPEVPIIIAHLGSFLSQHHTAHQQSVWLARTFQNVYLDTSSVNLFEWLETALAELGPDRLIFGSDGPGLHCGVELARIRFLDLDEDGREKVLWRNIARLVGPSLAEV